MEEKIRARVTELLKERQDYLAEVNQQMFARHTTLFELVRILGDSSVLPPELKAVYETKIVVKEEPKEEPK